ncbi:MAG: hypothetical protein QM710_14945 [Flavobacterium sp.]
MITYDRTHLSFVVYKNNTFFAVTWIEGWQNTFLTKNTIDTVANTVNTDLWMITDGLVTNVKYNNNHIYLEKNTDYYSSISKIDYNINPLWTKRFDHDSPQFYDGRIGILSQVTSNEAILLQGVATSTSIYSNFPIANLDLDLNSCRTNPEDLVSISQKHSNFVMSDLPFELSDVEMELQNITYVSITEISSEKSILCEMPPVDIPPCDKDIELCKLYNELLDGFNKCLTNPEMLPEKPDYKSLIKCVEKFMSLLKEFIKKNPQYNNIILTFEDQFAYIDFFIKEPEVESYTTAWSILNEILIYLSSLGNCSCENAIDVDENTWLQSPNFYLQAAGSEGNDSSKGIHLRWTFSGILGEQHMPKGNYSFNYNNFNKPNDFVKIHRAKYSPKTFVLSFDTPPQSINDAQRYWLYKFNNDTRVFFVYFRNTNKYDQVRLAIDPFTDPLAFLKQYGNELIEVENKRELFFASELKVSVTGTPDIQLEALSVRENTVFTPKFLSFRKSYDEAAISSDRLNLYCENGRMVRFKCNHCYPLALIFEFYSDFIKETTSKGAWNLLGNYALTKRDPLAISRLAKDDIDGSWLRFNDEAYVRADNYIDKWNGTFENSFDRNIKNVVESYITLSEELDNPTATELINVNLTYQSDPDEPLTDDELTEVNNLNLLRIMSTDFHIARMLGLGTLDLQPLVFEGSYVYLASYTTFGDLGNGPQTVKHLSMSLPTAIDNQRLPLPIDLHSLVPGFLEVSDDADDDYINTHDGYSFDGKKRFVSLVTENLIQDVPNPAFYQQNADIDFSTFTVPVFAGIESRKVFPGDDDTYVWEKPELTYDSDYENIDTEPGSYETIPLIIPDPGNALYVDIQTQTGTYHYATYGINWFSRATSSELEKSIDTQLKPYNSLKPPSNVLPQLIRPEFPLMFTSQAEQNRFGAIVVDPDKTLVRLQFDYNSDQELLSYQVPEGSLVDFVSDTNSIYPDQDEVMGDYIEIHYRNSLPKKIIGKALAPVLDEGLFMSRIKTGSYLQVSTGETFDSEFPAGTTAAHFIGGYFLMGDQKFLIHNIQPGTQGLDFIVYKQQLGDSLVDGEEPDLDPLTMITPAVDADGYFVVVENMQNTTSWGAEPINPNSFMVSIGNPDWTIHRELVKTINDVGVEDQFIEKTRGIWENAVIERVNEIFMFYPETGAPIQKNRHRGLYKITFVNFHLNNHPQLHSAANSVEWCNGTVRLFTDSNYNDVNGEIYDSRKSFTVFRTENIGTAENLILYVNDPDFILDENGDPSSENDYILNSNASTLIKVHYYPSYRVYLYHDDTNNLNEGHILPDEGEGSRYSIFGLKSVDLDYTETDTGLPYKSKFSVPAAMVAQEVIEAKVPGPPKGAKYTTRPDFYGKSTYTITTSYSHRPYGILYYRADNQGFLAALYKGETITTIKEGLKQLGGNEELYFTNRWENFLDFNLLGSNTVEDPTAPGGGKYGNFPLNAPEADRYRLPLPDKTSFFENINAFIDYHNQRFNATVPHIQNIHFGTIALNAVIIPASVGQNDAVKLIDFVKEAVMNAFVPLTEVPVIYKFIKDRTYKPVNKKQKIRDRDGYLIKPPMDPNESTEFDMAPMMKNISDLGENKIQFTDFTIDGTSDNIYFYSAKELSSQIKMSGFSSILGPIKLVNSSPPEAPKVKSMIPVLENRELGIGPKISFEIASYPEVQNIKKVNLYRTFDRLDSNSVQSMELVKVIDIDILNLTGQAIWTIEDDFSDLTEVPFGDPLFYRLTVSRKIEYAEAVYDAADNPVVLIDYAPSQPSKIIASTMVENYLPKSPVIEYYSEPLVDPDTELKFITLHWNETAYKADYYLYKLNSQGNWIEIAKVIADREVKGDYHYFNTNDLSTEGWTEETVISSNGEGIYIHLEMTNINSPNLTVLSDDGTKLFHHFKVIAKNTSGMLSREENILTLYNEVTWTDIGGIAVPDRSRGMIIGRTFIVR